MSDALCSVSFWCLVADEEGYAVALRQDAAETTILFVPSKRGRPVRWVSLSAVVRA